MTSMIEAVQKIIEDFETEDFDIMLPDDALKEEDPAEEALQSTSSVKNSVLMVLQTVQTQVPQLTLP